MPSQLGAVARVSAEVDDGYVEDINNHDWLMLLLAASRACYIDRVHGLNTTGDEKGSDR
jgi:hypothetical protein